MKALRYPLEIAASATLIALVTVTFAQVVFRYVLEAPLSWSEEVARFLLMWLAALSAAYAFKVRAHFALRFVVDRFDDRWRRATVAAVGGVVVVFLATFAWQALRFTFEVREMQAPATEMSMAIPYSSAFVGSALMLFYAVRNLWNDLTGAETTDAGQEAVDEA